MGVSPEIVASISSVAIEAIKILGPAGIAAWAGFKAGEGQARARLSELEEQNRFKAKEHMFAYYQGVCTRLQNDMNAIGKTMGEIVVDLEPPEDEEEAAEQAQALQFLRRLFATLSNNVPCEVEMLKAAFPAEGRAQNPYFQRLEAAISKTDWTKIPDTAPVLLDRAHDLFEVYTYLMICAQILLGRKSEELFAPHVSEAGIRRAKP
jgi:hypothetical protein